MATGSFIEMFMTTFGWHLYDIVWGVISSTGLAYLPILAAIIDNVVSPVESQEAKSAAVTSLRRLEIDIVRIIVMMMLAVSPLMTLEFGSVSHTKACQGETYNAGSSGTAFEEALNDTVINNTQAKVPPWFYLVMSITGGVNDSIIVSLPCELNIREIEYEISTVQITDPHLRRETQLFVSECYKPARADFFNNSRAFPDNLPNDDIDWIGSKHFNNTYYKTHYSQNPIPSFEFDSRRSSDASHISENGVTPDSGYPSCWEWWNDDSVGLSTRLLEQYPPDMITRANNLLRGFDDSESNEYILRQLMINEGDSIMDGLDLGKNNSMGNVSEQLMDGEFMEAASSFGDGVGEVVGAAGGFITSALIKPVLFFIKEMAPYIQSTMLMAIYFLLPWVLLVGNYEWSTIKTSTITIFGIKFWTCIWAVVDLLDNKLAQSIKAASGVGTFTQSNIMLGVILDVLILALYMGLPYFFLQMLGWAGERGASAVNSQAGTAEGGGRQAGSKGASMAEGALNK